MGEDAHMIDDMPPREMYKLLKEARADIMLSGGRSQFVALKAKMPWLDINQERHYAYAGYEGMVELVREIDKALSNPVWEQVRTPAPWDEVTWEQRADEANAAEEALAAKAPSPRSPLPRGERGRTARHSPPSRMQGGHLTSVAQSRSPMRRERAAGCRRGMPRTADRWRGDADAAPHRPRSIQRRQREGDMAKVVISKKACTVNPLKMSQPIGGALAFMGIKGCMPLLHGSQGCTSFGLVLFVRHFREAIPMQTTAMSEVATVLGGYRECRAGRRHHRQSRKASDDRHLLDRRHRDQGRRRGRLYQADPPEPARTRSPAARLCLDARFQGCVPGRLGEAP